MVPIASNSNGHKALLVSLAAIFMLLGCAPKGYVKYRPVDYDMHRGGYFFSKSPISNEHLKGIKFVFDYYGVDYIEKDSQTLFIPLSLLQDTNYVFNCTEKADDLVWMEYKKKELRGDFTKAPLRDSIITYSSKGHFIEGYYTNTIGNRTVQIDSTNQILTLNVITKGMIGDSIDVIFAPDDYYFVCKEHPLNDSLQLKGLKITSDTISIELQVLDKK